MKLQEALEWSSAIYKGWVDLLEHLESDLCEPHGYVHLRAGEHKKLLADLRGIYLKIKESEPAEDRAEAFAEALRLDLDIPGDEADDARRRIVSALRSGGWM